MNKNVVYLLFIALVLVTIFSMKFSLDSKIEMLREYSNIVNLEHKINKIVTLKKKYKNRKNLNNLKKICEIKYGQKTIITCKNLNAQNFKKVEKLLFKSDMRLNRFTIEKGEKNSVNLVVEIIR